MPALTDGALCQGSTGEFLVSVAIVSGGLVIRWFRLWHREKLTTPSELLLAVAIGQEAIVADALKALGQNVQQEAANELAGGERHRLLSVAIAIVPPMEADFAVVDVEKAVIGDSNAMGVSRDVGQDLFGAGEGRFGVDTPFCLSRGSEVALKGAAVAERFQASAEGQSIGIEGLLQRAKEQPTEETSEHADGQKEVGPAADPTTAVGREPAAGDDAMQVRMMEQCLAPSVEDGEEAELCAEMLGVSSDCPQSFGSGVKQDVVDRFLVVMGDGGDLLRHSEDDVEVWHCEELGSSVLKPLGTRQGLALRAVAIAARVVRDALVAAGIALLEVAAERCRATLLDRRHHATLRRRQRGAVLLTIGLTVAAEHVRHFRRPAGHQDDA